MADLQATDYYFSKDTYLDQNMPDTNYGWISTMRLAAIYGKEDSYEEWPILYTDVSGLAADRVITEAKLRLYVSTITKDPEDDFLYYPVHTYYIPNIHDDWVESEATWNEKKSGENWGGAGTDNHPNPWYHDGPAGTGWWELLVSSFAAFARRGPRNGIFDTNLDIDYYLGADRIVIFASDEDVSDPPGSPEYLRPHLRVTHEPRGRQVFM